MNDRPQDVDEISTPSGGYKQVKAKLGRSRVRRWCWAPFVNPARTVSYTQAINFDVIIIYLHRYNFVTHFFYNQR